MTHDDIRKTVLTSLGAVAPDADTSTLGAEEDLREALDIDSMDFLNFITAVHEALHVDIPEADYPQLSTLAGCVHYLASKLEAAAKT